MFWYRLITLKVDAIMNDVHAKQNERYRKVCLVSLLAYLVSIYFTSL